MAGLPLGGGKSVILADEERHQDARTAARVRQGGRRAWRPLRHRRGRRHERRRHDRGRRARRKFVAGLPNVGGRRRRRSRPAHLARRVPRASRRRSSARSARTASTGCTSRCRARAASPPASRCTPAAEGARLSIADVDQAKAQKLADAAGGKVVVDRRDPGARSRRAQPQRARRDPHRREHRRAATCRSSPAAPTTSWRRRRTARGCTQRGILYAPDYVINAGGIINVCTEYLGDGDASLVRAAHRGHSGAARADLGRERGHRPRPGRGRRRHGAAPDRERAKRARDRCTRFANPARFLRFARPATAWLLLIGPALLAARRNGRGPDADSARLSAGRDGPHPLHPRARRPGSAWPAGWGLPLLRSASWSGAIRLPRSPGARSRPPARPSPPSACDRLDLGPPDLGHLVGMGRAADLDADPVLPLPRLHRARPRPSASAAAKGGSPRSSAWSGRSTCRSSIIRCCGGARSTRARASA